MMYDGTYRSLHPQAYDDGYAYGIASQPEGKFAEGYSGVYIGDAADAQDRRNRYSAYNEGYCAGLRTRWLRERNDGESLLDWTRRTSN